MVVSLLLLLLLVVVVVMMVLSCRRFARRRYSTDMLMPPSESLSLAKAFESVRTKRATAAAAAAAAAVAAAASTAAAAAAAADAKVKRQGYLGGLLPPLPETRVHCEVLETHLGHDAFLVDPRVLIARLDAFLSDGACPQLLNEHARGRVSERVSG